MSTWYLKLAVLIAISVCVLLVSSSDWGKNRRYAAFFLVFLFAQTGFACQFQKGYFTSIAEIVYFALLLVMFFDARRPETPKGIYGVMKFYFFVSVIGVFTSFVFDILWINVFIEVKSYVGYVFYLILVPYLVRDKQNIVICLWLFVVFSLIPLSYARNLHELSELTGVMRDNPFNEWGAMNIFVGFILPIIFFAVALFDMTSRTFLKIFLLSFIGVCFFMLLYLKTRTAWFTTVICFFVYMVLAQKKIKYIVLIMVGVAVLSFAGGLSVAKKIIAYRVFEQTIEKQDTSLEKRLHRWKVATETFKAYPFTGSGWGGYLPLNSQGKASDYSLNILPRWHNVFCEILSQLGLPGILTFYGLFFAVFKFVWQQKCGVLDAKDRSLWAGLISAALACFLYGHGEQQFYKIETASVSWFVMGLMVTFSQQLKSDELQLAANQKQKCVT